VRDQQPGEAGVPVIEKINIAEKLGRFRDLWSPKIVAQVNDTDLKLVKVHGSDFPWHSHADEDELFWVLAGELVIETRDGAVALGPGEVAVVPRGVEHRTLARVETQLVLIERSGIRHTGNVEHELTVKEFERI
jgi:mannose-6-phosphate isomerase-like protein (cupin superfamily)